MASSATAPVCNAYRHGAAQGYRDAASSGEGGGNNTESSSAGAPASGPPAWAQSLARRQRMTQAGMMAAHSLREGDRAGMSSGPDLKNRS
jgi:type IV secretion system protein TrbL